MTTRKYMDKLIRDAAKLVGYRFADPPGHDVSVEVLKIAQMAEGHEAEGRVNANLNLWRWYVNNGHGAR